MPPTPKPKAPVLTDLPARKVASLVKAYAAGATIQGLADSIGLKYGTMRTVLVRAGVEFRRGGRARTKPAK